MKKRQKYVSGIKKETYNLLFKNKNLLELHEDTEKNDRILDNISFFTMFDGKNMSISDKIFKKVYEKIYHIDCTGISYNKENEMYEYVKGDKVIPFTKFSDYIKDEKVKRELFSIKRFRKCHKKSLNLVGAFENPTRILTGTYNRHGKRFLHSVIEMQTSHNIYIVDYTLNLIMSKQYYYELIQFQEIESINDIDVLNDEKDGTLDFLRVIPFKDVSYLTFRKELKKDIEKNKNMLNPKEDDALDKRIIEVKKQREVFERE